MNAYEELTELIRQNGKRYNPPVPQIGIVSGRGKIKIDGIEIKPEDYLMNCNLRLDEKEKVFIHTAKPSSGEFMTDSSHNGTLKEMKNNVLQEGDRVLMLKLEGFEKFVLIAKVVEPK